MSPSYPIHCIQSAQRQRAWVYRHLHIGLAEGSGDQDALHQAGSPCENGHIESFRDKLRDECPDPQLFGNLREACIILESWRIEYNERHPHSALGYRDPRASLPAPGRTSLMAAGRPQNPAPLAAAGVRGELRINATRWLTNETTTLTNPQSFSRENGIEIPGLAKDATEGKTKLHVGTLLGKIFGKNSTVECDGFLVTKIETPHYMDQDRLVTLKNYTIERLLIQTHFEFGASKGSKGAQTF